MKPYHVVKDEFFNLTLCDREDNIQTFANDLEMLLAKALIFCNIRREEVEL